MLAAAPPDDLRDFTPVACATGGRKRRPGGVRVRLPLHSPGVCLPLRPRAICITPTPSLAQRGGGRCPGKINGVACRCTNNDGSLPHAPPSLVTGVSSGRNSRSADCEGTGMGFLLKDGG